MMVEDGSSATGDGIESDERCWCTCGGIKSSLNNGYELKPTKELNQIYQDFLYGRQLN